MPPRRRRFLTRAALLLVLLIVATPVAGWLALRGSMPRYEGRIVDAALKQPVRVERDALGTVTVEAASRRDASWALGYVHAQERFFEMDVLRRRAAGELAELFGKAALPLDRTARAHRMRARMERALAQLAPQQRDALDAYRDGVNAGLAGLAVRPFAYLATFNQPAPWRSEDTLLVIAAMAFTLNDAEGKRELAFARMHAALPASAYAFLTAGGGGWDAPIAGAALSWPDPPAADALDLRTLDPALLRGSRGVTDPRVPGSNAFAVGGALAGGAALVANDMHLDLRVPNLWFRTRIVYPDPRSPGTRIDVTGAGLPGAPAVVAGSNRHVAWGFTNSYVDSTDWVRVQRDPHDPTRYRVPEGWATIEKHAERIRVHGADDDTIEVEETRWGPIIAQDADGVALALAWVAQQPGGIDVDLVRLETARTVDEAVAFAQASGIPPQNLIVGDSAGSIAWTIAGRVPKRVGGYDPGLPSDWSHAGTGWDGWLADELHPLVANPPWQRLWSANQRPVEDAALALLGDGGYDLGARAMQIRDALRAREHFAPADLLEIQLDDRALFLEHWKDLLEFELNRAPASPLHEAMKAILADWHGRASTDSVAYRLVRSWRGEVVDSVMDGFAAAVRKQFPDFNLPKMPQSEQAVWKLLTQRPPHLLPPGVADWDALMIAALDRSGASLDEQPGGIAARRWGEHNTARIAHPLSRGLPAFAARWLDMPYEPLAGDSNMPRVQSPSFGASERFAVAPGDEAHGYFMMPGGQSGHPLSPYYGAGHEDWVRGTPTPFLPGPAQHVLEFGPAP
ncbi:penicillin acylase family protein [Dokdonella sp.]|uniref:penicillin acylase family protein n=1 Tax=Dokdonella sp. TaxID=2291710 RepID=UPI002F3F4971